MIPEKYKTGASWVGAGLGAGVPGISFFTTYVPPLFPITSVITAIPAAILFLVYPRRSKYRRPRSGIPSEDRNAGYFIGMGLILLVAYTLVGHQNVITDQNQAVVPVW